MCCGPLPLSRYSVSAPHVCRTNVPVNSPCYTYMLSSRPRGRYAGRPTTRRSTGPGCDARALLPAASALLVLALLLQPATGQIWTQAVPVLPELRGDLLEGLDMRCIGDGDYLTGCLMRDLYFDTEKGTFLFFGSKVGRTDAQSDDETRMLFEQQMKFLDHVRETSDFKMQWSARRPPGASATCRVSVPVHLRQEFPLGTPSFGHLLRDNYEGLMSIAKRFGLTPAYFSWVTWPAPYRRRGVKLSHVQEKYSTWLSKHATYTWEDLVSACNEASVARPQRKRKARYVHIETALASGVGKRWTPLGWRTKVCEQSSFKDLRDLAYSINSVPHVPAARQPRLVISFVYKQPGDKRRMILDEGLLRALQERYPDAELGVHDYILEDADTQLEWLSRTSVLVANVGSPSFRLLYLPDGAQVISVGPLEGEAQGTDGQMYEAAGRTFGETRDCWQFLDYIRFHEYHVTDLADVIFRKERKHKSPRKKEKPKASSSGLVMWAEEAKRIRDADVRVRQQQLFDVIELAIGNITSSAVGL